MPPKVNTDDKLSQMRSYVAANVAQLASSEKATLKDMFGARQRECREEASFYKFLWSYEKSFTNAQRTHAEETLAILTQYGTRSSDAHPAALTLAVRSSDDVQFWRTGVPYNFICEDRPCPC